MKEAVTKVIDTLTQEDIHGAFQKQFERYKCSRRRLLRRGLEFHVCTINKSAHTKKKSGNLSYAPHIYHHHSVVPLARISLTLSRYFSLSFIASGRSLGLHPVSSRSCCMYVRRPAFAWPYAGSTGVHHLGVRPCFFSSVLRVWFV